MRLHPKFQGLIVSYEFLYSTLRRDVVIYISSSVQLYFLIQHGPFSQVTTGPQDSILSYHGVGH